MMIVGLVCDLYAC